MKEEAPKRTALCVSLHQLSSEANTSWHEAFEVLVSELKRLLYLGKLWGHCDPAEEIQLDTNTAEGSFWQHLGIQPKAPALAFMSHK